MSLGIVVKGTEGLVLAADSRVTLSAEMHELGERVHVNFDNATKLLSFSEPNSFVGAVTYGQAAIGLRTANSFLPEFESELPEDERLSIKVFTERLRDFFLQQWENTMPSDYAGPPMTFVVGGFDKAEPYGSVYMFDVPHQPELKLQHEDGFGITWGGQREAVDRLMQGFDNRLASIIERELKPNKKELDSLYQTLKKELQLPVPIQAMALQDCVDLAVFFVRTTMQAQSLTVGIRGVGGPIDVVTITRRNGLTFVQRKQVTGE